VSDESAGPAESRREKYGSLPPAVRIEDTITSQDTAPVPEFEVERDPESEFIRFRS
jgi:hypothetical protein